MTEEKIKKLHELEYLKQSATYMINNGSCERSEIGYLFKNDPDFRQEFCQLRDKYLNKYQTAIDEL